MSGIQLSHIYAFSGGAFVGRFGGIIPSVIVIGALLYIVNPNILTYVNLENINNVIKGLMK